MKRFSVNVMIAVGLVATTAAVLNAEGDDASPASKILCPVMDEPVNFLIAANTTDGPVYVCCKGCVKKIEQDPSKYAKKIAAQRAALAKLPKVQVTCPISGEPVNPEITVENNGEKVAFCCGGCAKKFKAKPDSFKAKLAASYTYQTTCPVMGKKINPKSFTTLKSGAKVYYCCPGCDSKLRGNPDKYADALEAQGVFVNWAKEK